MADGKTISFDWYKDKLNWIKDKIGFIWHKRVNYEEILNKKIIWFSIYFPFLSLLSAVLSEKNIF